jgi:DNA helicase IV
LEPPLVVQGHPGTGKTVIAAHRAAWLVHPERGEANANMRVLIVGPNDYYAHHLKGVLDSLVARRSQVLARGLSRLLLQLRRMDYKLQGELDGEHYDVSNELGGVIDAAARRLRTSRDLLKAPNTEAAAELIYNALKSNKAAGTPLTEDRDLARYLRKLPRWKLALTERRFLPLAAYCSISAVPYEARGFDHVIVDEAQDVRPLEWRIIRTLNRGQSWTILGDMNQRRSDWSYHSWDQLGVDLDISDERGRLTPDVFDRGYRSTGPIIKYANRLLPAKERGATLVQTDGPPPRVYKVKEGELPSATVAVASHLCGVYPQGTVAVITTTLRLVGDQMVRDGWRQDEVDTRVMKSGSHRVHLLTPENARGLEFDGVVVVEPAAFPENLARQGSLYTSLTRANRELAVVHARPLPDGLRNQGLASRISDLSV